MKNTEEKKWKATVENFIGIVKPLKWKKQCAIAKQEHSKKKEQRLRMQNQNSSICIGGILGPKIHTRKTGNIGK